MKTQIQSIAIKKLLANPENPNKMSKPNFIKLVRNIGRNGYYEPVIVRRIKQAKGYYKLINGYHRVRALMGLGYVSANCIVWNIDDFEEKIYLATLNRLGGKDDLAIKINMLKYLSKHSNAKELSKILTFTNKQIERLIRPIQFQKADQKTNEMYTSLVFFVKKEQEKKIEKALSLLKEQVKEEKTRPEKRAAALTVIAEYFMDNSN